ncbi:MAG: hypothetical protein K1X89_13500 [Myxococcaceae bacterium]|nr:hypothetical protein [Myxococcaceae bacterium]
MDRTPWVIRGGVVVLTVAGLVLTREMGWLAKALFIGPAAAVLAIAEYVWTRQGQRRAVVAVGQRLGLTAKPGIANDELEGDLGGFHLHYASESNNEVGRPVCVTVTLPPGPWSDQVAIGPKALAYRMKKSVPDGEEQDLGDGLRAFSTSAGRAIVAKVAAPGSELSVLFHRDFAKGHWGAALLNGKLITATYTKYVTEELLTAHLGALLDAARALTAER